MSAEHQRPSSQRPSGGRKPARRRLWAWIRLALVPLALCALVGLLVLTVVSHRVAARFEQRERESPTRIYGHIITLLEGEAASQPYVTAALKRQGYRQTRAEPSLPGEFRVSRGVTIYTRPFEAPGGSVPSHLAHIRFTTDDPDGQIESIEDERTGASMPQLQLEPEVLTSLYGEVLEDRKALQVSEFPQALVDAVIVCEDRRFYGHYGIDPVGVLRATAANMHDGAIRQGGSTLTQQLAKNLFFDQERTWSRKAQEAVVAIILERRYSKERILQAYLNEAYLGQRGAVSVRGFAQAASFYFGKDVAFLDLSESATLAGMIRSPGMYNPFVHPDKAVERRNQVLVMLEEAGDITAEEHKAAERQALRVRKDKETRSNSRGILYLADYVRQMIGPEAGDLSRAGLSVFTTIDPALQRRAEDSLTRGLAGLEHSFPSVRRNNPGQRIQGAMVVLDRRDGSVLAMVGGRDYATSQFNRITQAHRQPGSLFKPFVYLAGYEAAREAGWGSTPFTPGTSLEDEPLTMTVAGKEWAPANYDGEFRGSVTAQLALEQSLNVPTVRAALEIGLPEVAAMAKAAGIQSALRPFPSLALGAQEVTPLEIASAYATIANGGMRCEPGIVESIEEVGGRQLFERHRKTERVISPQSAYLITVALQGALDRGTGRSSRALGFTGTAAGKTGTTDDYRDAWFAGYTPDLVALVWVGFDDGTPTSLSGAQAALPIWVDFMQAVGEPRETFDEPDGIVWEQIDPTTGGLARWSCPDSRYVAFLEGTEPTEKCNRHGLFARWDRSAGTYQ